jgi:hypothetical protein
MLLSYAIGILGGWTTAWLVYSALPDLTLSLPLAILAGTTFGSWTLGTSWITVLGLGSAWLALAGVGWWMKRGALKRWDLLEA